MRVERPLRHDRGVLDLWRAAREGRLPHALLFEGAEGSGRFLAAQWLAAGMLCEAGPGPPCGACPGCKKVRSGGWRSNHPDLFVIDAVEEDEEQIRLYRIAYRPDASRAKDLEYCLERFFPYRPLEGEWRVALLREAHRMNPEAQNALLKMLEEPPRGTLLVLESHRSDLLLETVRSRCVRLRWSALTHEETAELLAAQGLDQAVAGELARWSGGSPGAALRLHREGAVAQRAVLAGLLRGETPPLAAAADVWELPGVFGGGTPRAQARERARGFLDLALAVLGDAQRARAGLGAAELAHGELAAETAGAPELRAALEACLQARADVDLNLAPEGALDRAALALAGVAPRSSRPRAARS